MKKRCSIQITKRLLILVFLGLVCHGLNAQEQDSIPTIKMQTLLAVEVRLILDRNEFQSGASQTSIDSAQLDLYRSGSIGDALNNHSKVFIKNYGPGNLTSTSIRGGTASQTSIFWNGYNIQSPMLGQTDLSYVPALLVDEVDVLYGSGGVAYGNSTQSGSIHLNSKASDSKSIKSSLNSFYGSFGNFSNQLKLEHGGENHSFRIMGYHQLGENNFSYKIPRLDENEVEKRIQTNSDFSQNGLMAELGVRYNRYQSLNVRYWTQESERGIGSVVVGSPSAARLNNQFQRVTADWKLIGVCVDVLAKTGFFSETLNYNDAVSGISSTSTFKTLINEVEAQKNFSPHLKLDAGILNTYYQSSSTNFAQPQNQNRTAFYSFLRYQKYRGSHQKMLASVGVRQMVVQNFKVPPTAQLGWDYSLKRGIHWKVQAARNYRLPTFNDLYFVPGGNVQLRPESGWSTENSFVLTNRKKQISLEFTGFWNQYKDMIVWQPTDGIWQPINLNVASLGFESSFQLNGTIQKNWKWNVRTNTSFTSSKNTNTGYQLIYVPTMNGNVSASIRHKKLEIGMNESYTGKRFISTNQQYFLDSYLISNFYLTKDVILQKMRGKVGIRLNNVMNKSYQAIVNYPMPGRTFNLFINLVYIQPKKKKEKQEEPF